MSQFSNPITAEQWERAVKIGDVSFVRGAEMQLPKIQAARALFDERNVSTEKEEVAELPSASGLASMLGGENQDAPLVSITDGDSLTMTQKTRAARIEISDKFLRYNKYPVLAQILQNVGSRLVRGYGQDMQHKFTFAGDDSYTYRANGGTISVVGADGVSLLDDSHPTNNGSTWDNLLGSGSSYRLSEATYQDCKELGNTFLDHNDQLVIPEFDTIVTGNHVNTCHTAIRLTKQTSQVSIATLGDADGGASDTVLNGLNPIAGTVRHLQLPLMATTASGGANSAKTRFWFLVDTGMAKAGNLRANIGLAPKLYAPVMSQNGFTMVYKAQTDYDLAHINAGFIAGALAT